MLISRIISILVGVVTVLDVLIIYALMVAASEADDYAERTVKDLEHDKSEEE